MKVRVKLMASLRGKLPAEAKGVTEVDVPASATIAEVLAKLGVAEGQVHAVMVNDELEHNRGRALTEGDALVVLPPVAGG
jgi:molybdopterin converting factor small subunit